VCDNKVVSKFRKNKLPPSSGYLSGVQVHLLKWLGRASKCTFLPSHRLTIARRTPEVLVSVPGFEPNALTLKRLYSYRQVLC
jgi:hypothetical protein